MTKPSYHIALNHPLFLAVLFELSSIGIKKALTEAQRQIELIQHHDVRGFRAAAKVYSDKHYKKINDQHAYHSSVNTPTIPRHEYYSSVRYLKPTRDIGHCEGEGKSGFLTAASAMRSLTKTRCPIHLAPPREPQRGPSPLWTVSNRFTTQLSSAKWMLAHHIIRKCILHIKKARMNEPFSGVFNNQLFNVENSFRPLANNVRSAIFCT